jgi:hypothetical protein
MNIKLKLNKLYYKYIDMSIVNHYKLLLLTEEYRQIGQNYFYKYPNATGWINLNKELFDSNKQAKIEYMEGSKKQAEIKKEFFNVRKILCKKDENKDCIICSPFFQDFYVYRNYHYEQCTEHVIESIMKDIQNMDKK